MNTLNFLNTFNIKVSTLNRNKKNKTKYILFLINFVIKRTKISHFMTLYYSILECFIIQYTLPVDIV